MRRIPASFLAAALLAPVAARAYVPSAQNGAFEIKFGPYTPNVDEQPGIEADENGEKPYKRIFEDDWMFLTVLELDWQFVHPPGFSLGLGGSVGFMQVYAPAKNEYGYESADYTVLNVMPFGLLGVVRVDVLADELGVPLVPYFKGGLAWYLWWVLEGGGDVASAGNDKAIGGTPGWQINPGLMFRLDDLDPMSARTFDNEVGVNHSYLFGEFLWATIEGLGDDNHMYLSDMTFLAGVALEF